MRVTSGHHAGCHRQCEGSALPAGHRRCHHQCRRARALQDVGENPKHREADPLHLRAVHRDIHLLVRPEINSIQDLEGKKVSFHSPGAGVGGHRADPVQATGCERRSGLHQQRDRPREDEDRRVRRSGEPRPSRRTSLPSSRTSTASSFYRFRSKSSTNTIFHRSSLTRTTPATSSLVRKSRRSPCNRCSRSTIGRGKATATGA